MIASKMGLSQHQSLSKQEIETENSFDDLEGAFCFRFVGKVPGPTKRNGQKTFCIVAGMFDKSGAQAIHTKANGEEVPVTFISYPIETDENPAFIIQ